MCGPGPLGINTTVFYAQVGYLCKSELPRNPLLKSYRISQNLNMSIVFMRNMQKDAPLASYL